ncbi:MAG: 30S ribosomal protein S7 [Thermoguttaceae bacterium]|nr:30S ribosomal protein S7 [Thermoguttaceae bacterium]
MGRITASKKQLKGDPVYDSLLASKFINCLMWDGKKSASRKIFYDALDLLAKKVSDVSPIEVFTQALENVKPAIEVRSKRVGGASYQVPMPVRANRAQSLSIRWILMAVRDKKGQPTAQKLAAELFDAYNKQGVAYTKRENVHRMAEANKAFAHFAN